VCEPDCNASRLVCSGGRLFLGNVQNVSEAPSIAGLTCKDSDGTLWILTGGRSGLGLECHKVQSKAKISSEFPGFVWPAKMAMSQHFVSAQAQFVLFNEVTPVLLCTPQVARAFGKLQEGMRFTSAYDVVDAELKIAELQLVKHLPVV
jgi:hypothetical protein